MRAPHRRRPLVRSIAIPTDVDLIQLAKRVHYIGSPEHKDGLSFAGRPRPYADASICPRELNHNQKKVIRWLREAVRKGALSAVWEGPFPKYVWLKKGNEVYEARLVNRGKGEYKGYPLTPEEWPKGLEEIYD